MMKDLFSFEVSNYSEKISSKAKSLDNITITFFVLISLIIAPLFVNTIYQSTQNLLILRIRSEFYQKFNSFNEELIDKMREENIGHFEIGFMGSKNNYLNFSSIGSTIKDSSDVHAKVFLTPRNTPLEETLVVECELCTSEQLKNIKIAARRLHDDRGFDTYLSVINMYFKTTQEIAEPGINILGVDIEAGVIPLLILIIAFFFRHQLNEYEELKHRLQKAVINHSRNLSMIQRKRLKEMVELINPKLLNDSLKNYALHPFSRKGSWLFVVIFFFILTLLPISYTLILEHFGASGFYYDFNVVPTILWKLLLVTISLQLVFVKIDMLKK